MNHRLQAIRRQMPAEHWNHVMNQMPQNLALFLEQESADTAIREDSVDVELTPQQMILLLSIYSNTMQWQFIDPPQLLVQDTRALLKHGLVYFDGALTVTPKGTLRVMQTLEGAPR